MRKDRDWVERVISHQETEAVPYYFDFTPPAKEKIERHYGSPIAERLRFPICMTGLKSIKPLYADPSDFGKTARDEFGVVWSTSSIDRGSPVRTVLNEANLSGYKFPDFKASYRFKDIAGWCRKNKEHYTFIWVGDLWERATFMRGMENILMDLTLNPKFVNGLLRSISDYVLGTMEVLFDKFEFDGIALSDDYGAQSSMLMSPEAWRRFIRPCLQEIYNCAKNHGRTVFQHSDGCIYPIIGDLIDMGCDILHPVQPEAMDVFNLKREFGKDLTFMGGMRTQDLLVRGMPQDIRDEVKKLKREMARGGGYIVSNGITVQADVPLDNMVAMIEEARERD